jgi:hypothetical protein
MLIASKYIRIKAYAKVFSKDLTMLDSDQLIQIVRLADADEWLLVEDAIKAAA